MFFSKVNFLTNAVEGASDEDNSGKKTRPHLVVAYNSVMHGVDKSDNFMNLYLYCHRKVPNPPMTTLFLKDFLFLKKRYLGKKRCYLHSLSRQQ
jgi:hypothetical protein